jgi:hypothetical protein
MGFICSPWLRGGRLPLFRATDPLGQGGKSVFRGWALDAGVAILGVVTQLVLTSAEGSGAAWVASASVSVPCSGSALVSAIQSADTA